MKHLQEYINESITRIFIELDKDKIDENEVIKIESSSFSDKYFKGNKNNCCYIEFKLNKNSKANYEALTNIEVLKVGLCDDIFNGHPDRYVNKEDLKDLNAIIFEKESDHVNLYVCKAAGNNRDTEASYYYIPMEAKTKVINDIIKVNI